MNAGTEYRYIRSAAGIRSGHPHVEGTRIAVHDVAAASRSSLMILAMAGLSLLVFVVACFLPVGEERN
jgi:uncharacterized protein (DUF433 family)